ncbi:MAG: glycosyl transferase, partial [Ignavibacteria bacterium CG_4_9_14_3_um_filter_36_18]
MIKLSSIIIAKNEEKNIGRCIKSQLGCVDEIVVVVDEKSSDRTAEIVQTFPEVKHSVSKWQGYSGTKNFALQL